jgi:GH43 family beta-xylosidase
MKRAIIFIATIFFLVSAACFCQNKIDNAETFRNPIFVSGADPWLTQKDGYYYYSGSMGGRLAIRKAKSLIELKSSVPKTVWTPPQGTLYSKELWAPELHFVRGKWYIYFAADDGSNQNHRMYALENPSPDPTEGTWEFKGKVSDSSDKWAIDGTVFEYSGGLYMIWSGWEGDVNGRQNLYIASMTDPWTISSQRVRISAPEYAWETIGDLNNPNDVPHVNVNEGPAALIHQNRLYVTYSASGCWTDNYCLGLLTFTGKGNLLDPGKWKKSDKPVFSQKPEAGVYAPGHNSFFLSPDGKEDWILYHANSQPGQGCGRYRSPRAQKFSWKKDGSPDFGEPLGTDVPVKIPSEGIQKK